MSLWRVAEDAAWVAGVLLLSSIVLDAWRIGRAHDERLLLSSREGEIEQDTNLTLVDLEHIEKQVGRAPGPRLP
jgi:hypothetical protein